MRDGGGVGAETAIIIVIAIANVTHYFQFVSAKNFVANCFNLFGKEMMNRVKWWEKNGRYRDDEHESDENVAKWQSRMKQMKQKEESHTRTQPTWNKTLQRKWWNIIITLLYSPLCVCAVGACILFVFQFSVLRLSYLQYFTVYACLCVYLYSCAFTSEWLWKNSCSHSFPPSLPLLLCVAYYSRICCAEPRHTHTIKTFQLFHRAFLPIQWL